MSVDVSIVAIVWKIMRKADKRQVDYVLTAGVSATAHVALEMIQSFAWNLCLCLWEETSISCRKTAILNSFMQMENKRLDREEKIMDTKQ